MKGGMLVTKSSTGTYLVDDIKVWIPHGEGTYITADNAVNSKDLYKALNSGILTLLVDSMPQSSLVPTTKVVEASSLAGENAKLREALAQSAQQGATLEAGMQALQQQLAQVLAVVGRLGSQPREAPAPVFKDRPLVQSPSSVEDPLPVFVPTDLISKNAEFRINCSTEETSEDTASKALSQLKELRRKV